MTYPKREYTKKKHRDFKKEVNDLVDLYFTCNTIEDFCVKADVEGHSNIVITAFSILYRILNLPLFSTTMTTSCTIFILNSIVGMAVFSIIACFSQHDIGLVGGLCLVIFGGIVLGMGLFLFELLIWQTVLPVDLINRIIRDTSHKKD